MKDTLTCRDRNGQVKWMQVALSPLNDIDGRVGNILEVASDVTEQHNATNISYSLASCQGLVMLVDQSMHVTYVNEALTKMLSQNEQEIRVKASEFSATNIIGTSLDWLDHELISECSGDQS